MDRNYNDQVTEVREERTAAPATNYERNGAEVPGSVLAARIVYYIGGALLALLGLRLLLALLGANRANPFADFVFSVSYPFVAPFFGLFGAEPAYGQSVLELSTIVAMIVYAILTAGIAKLFTLGRRDRHAV